MEVIPVIEVRSGRSTRSTFVRSDQPNILRDDVLMIAKRWKDEGATRLHVHDVDGARVGMPQNRDQVRDIVRRIGLPVQYSGGVRTPEVMERVLGWGVDRVVADANVTLDLALTPKVQQLGGRAVLELSPFQGKIPMPGAPRGAVLDVFDFLREMNQRVGWPRYICRTSLGDGGLATPGGEDLAKFLQQARKPVLVYSKFRSWDDLREVQKHRPEAIVIHEALYDGALSLPDLLRWADTAQKAPQPTASPELKPWMPGYKPATAPAAGSSKPAAPIVGIPKPASTPQRVPIPPLPPLPPKK